MASRYKKYMRLIETWPTNTAKGKSDLGSHLRKKIAEAFSSGESSTISDPDKCDKMFTSLQRISTDHYSSVYSRTVKLQGATGYSKEKLNDLLTEDGLERMRRQNTGIIRRLIQGISQKKKT